MCAGLPDLNPRLGLILDFPCSLLTPFGLCTHIHEYVCLSIVKNTDSSLDIPLFMLGDAIHVYSNVYYVTIMGQKHKLNRYCYMHMYTFDCTGDEEPTHCFNNYI